MRKGCTPLRWIRLTPILLLALGCGGDWLVSIYIDTPENGLFTTDPTVTVTGHVENFNPDFVADVTVNGASVLPLLFWSVYHRG